MNDQLRKRGQESLSDPPHSRPASARPKSLDEFDSAFNPSILRSKELPTATRRRQGRCRAEGKFKSACPERVEGTACGRRRVVLPSGPRRAQSSRRPRCGNATFFWCPGAGDGHTRRPPSRRVSREPSPTRTTFEINDQDEVYQASQHWPVLKRPALAG